MSTRGWPDRLYVVRHGESSGNVARDRAEAAALDRIDIAERDVDVPLSPRGEEQAQALGQWIATTEAPPTVVWVSPYLRAVQTAETALAVAGLEVPRVVDERLREREFGVLDGLTRRGITATYPEEAERRAKIGKFYHRPPGGESWSDVLLRLRAAVHDIRLDCQGERVLLVAHQVVVLLTRYVVEGLDERSIMEIDAQGDVANCAVTSYAARDGALVLERYNEVGHLALEGAPVTAEPDVPAAPR